MEEQSGIGAGDGKVCAVSKVSQNKNKYMPIYIRDIYTHIKVEKWATHINTLKCPLANAWNNETFFKVVHRTKACVRTSNIQLIECPSLKSLVMDSSRVTKAHGSTDEWMCKMRHGCVIMRGEKKNRKNRKHEYIMGNMPSRNKFTVFSSNAEYVAEAYDDLINWQCLTDSTLF